MHTDPDLARAPRAPVAKAWYKIHMNERVKKLSQEIRKLSPDEQAELIDELLVLSHDKPLPKSDKAWLQEIDRRIDLVERGAVKAVDARKALRKYRKP
jgi:RNA polymerase-interacting CarD/CdnL/TRCF family regulator